MQKPIHVFAAIMLSALGATAQKLTDKPLPDPQIKDSITVKVHPSYDEVSGIHRWLFGENYRKEWAAPVKLPVIRISQIYGGLKPTKEGGGMQSKSLRLVDKSGREYALRSVEKTPDKLLPKQLQGTFAVDWLDDALSGQHPYSALIVPPLAKAAKVPHAHPIIGMVADDPALGQFSKKFANTVCLLEEREPLEESDNTEKALSKLIDDNDNHFDGPEFLRARLLDLLLGDWDRHEDQWRWTDIKKGDGKNYEAIPRDRDQVFHVVEGLFPNIASLPYIDPAIDGFVAGVPRVKYSLFKTRFIKSYTDAQMSHEEWMRITNDFVAAETDAVLEEGLRRLPREVYRMRHDELLAKLKGRRDAIPKAMDEYYKFIYRIVDIQTSDKNELVSITDGPNNGMLVTINKIKKDGTKGDVLLDMNYEPQYTHEVRLYVSGGDDRVVVNTTATNVDLRVVGGHGAKTYEGIKASNSVKLYDKPDSITFISNSDIFRKRLSRDTNNVRFVPTYPYNVWMPLATAGLNRDDGFLFGAGIQYIKKDGFRKLPYTSLQQLLVTHSFSTDAYRIKYFGEWMQALGGADIVVKAFIQAPDNTLNFFGFGNATPLVKIGDYRTYYRTRFDTYQFDPAVRWHVNDSTTTISVGPSFQYYHMDPNDNIGRLVKQPLLVNSYDSLIVGNDKMHLGLAFNYTDNHRKGGIFVDGGYYFTLNIAGYAGLNGYSRSYAQIRPEFTFYTKLTSNGRLVLANRTGGGITIGDPAFYQGMYLGGQGNLLGYLQNRFSGKHMIYNNLQARLKLANIKGYILPGQLGLTGFYDAGRVWSGNNINDSNTIHTGVGGGAYFSPAALVVVQALVGHSTEGWYPYISFNFRL